MQILITGGTGFIGSALARALVGEGHQLVILSRQARASQANVRFLQSLDQINPDEPIEAIINLAGASLASRRWTTAYRDELLNSRLDTTRGVIALIKRLQRKPHTLLSASAIGYYGHHGDEELSEDSATVPCFSQQLCQQWEAVAMTAEEMGTRVCLLRFGVVLDAEGGALTEMTRSFRLGVASWAGSGCQWLSWVHRQDAVRAVLFLLAHPTLTGPVNITAPGAVTARGLAQALSSHFRTFIRAGVPGPLMRLLFGQMAEELLLNGQRVVPAKLAAAGFEFLYPDINSALEQIYVAYVSR